MNDIAVSKDGVIKLLKGLNPSKALGPDELHPRVLKELATELGLVFAHLFQQSIDTGEIPKEWSLANICPLFKKSDRSPACNYRPVSLTCVPCKLLEHIDVQISWLILMNINSCQIGNMHSGKVGWLCWGLTSQSTISQSCRDGAIASWVINQYFRGVKCLAQGHNTATVGLEPRTSRSGVSFRKGHSCETQMTTIINDWAKILDNRGQVDTFILDFEKAFDTPLMNSLKANCLAMESVARHWNG